MTRTIRILHVFGIMNLGGAESRIMDLYRAIDKNRVQFDFVVHTEQEGYFDREIKEMGGRIFRVPPFRVYNVMSYRHAFFKLFREHPEFKMMQGHMTSTASIYLPIAKRCGIQTAIAHARSAGVDKNFKGTLTRMLRKNLAEKADILFACSELAGKAVFGEKAWNSGKVYFVPNAIDAGKYRYDLEMRRTMRKEMNLDEDVLVIGHVGSFRYAKNHEYLLRVFEQLQKLNTKTELLLLGEGERMQKMRELAGQLGVSHKVHFLGNQKDVWKYYQAFDYIVFPSRYEGMPGTIVEAQAAGLKCLISDAISKDTVFTDLVKQKSIEAEPCEWAKEVLQDVLCERIDSYEEVKKAGFDVKTQADRMMVFYETGVWKGTE